MFSHDGVKVTRHLRRRRKKRIKPGRSPNNAASAHSKKKIFRQKNANCRGWAHELGRRIETGPRAMHSAVKKKENWELETKVTSN